MPKCLIGRGDECHLRPQSEAISRRHCVIITSDTEVAVRDLNSRNGTFVNGERVAEETLLLTGDVLKVGPLEFELMIEQTAAKIKRPRVTDIKQAAARTAEGSSVQSNATHAERQLASWLQNVADDKWRSRIQRIAAEINYSPCTLCSVDLKTIAVLTPNADAASRALSWTRPYIDKKRQGADNRSTTNASLGEIASAGWTVTPNQVGDLPVADKDDKLLVPGKR